MTKWEYLIIAREMSLRIGELNHLGLAGWELVQIDNGRLFVTYHFKRPLNA